MIRVILFLFFIIVIYLFFKQAQRRQQIHHTKTNHPHNDKETITMVQCAHCHIHLPQHEAIFKNNHYWCSEEHAKKGMKS